jgi:hypothetical protein
MVVDGLQLLMQQKKVRTPPKRLELPLIRSTRTDKLEIDSEKIYEIIDFP